MAELNPAGFSDLVSQLYAEAAVQGAVFGLPRKKWHLPKPGDADLSVLFHGRTAGNPSGPASGPHTQMAQNLLLSYAAGGRVCPRSPWLRWTGRWLLQGSRPGTARGCS